VGQHVTICACTSRQPARERGCAVHAQIRTPVLGQPGSGHPLPPPQVSTLRVVCKALFNMCAEDMLADPGLSGASGAPRQASSSSSAARSGCGSAGPVLAPSELASLVEVLEVVRSSARLMGLAEVPEVRWGGGGCCGCGTDSGLAPTPILQGAQLQTSRTSPMRAGPAEPAPSWHCPCLACPWQQSPFFCGLQPHCCCDPDLTPSPAPCCRSLGGCCSRRRRPWGGNMNSNTREAVVGLSTEVKTTSCLSKHCLSKLHPCAPLI